MADEKENLIHEIRKRFSQEYLQDKSDKYDSRDVERLQSDDAWVESYLLWRHNVIDDTLKMIDESLKWRKDLAVNDLTESAIPKWCFEIGATFLHGYDKESNKLFWFKVKLHIRDAKTYADKKRCVAFWLERYNKREPGKLLTVVFDMSESGLSNIDMDFVRFVINCFKIYYPKYLSKIVIFEMPWIMNAAFKIIKGWLGPEAINMLKFANRSEMLDYISAEYLPPHMGGTDPFKYSYPPLPDDDFQTPMCENGLIISEDDSESKEENESDIRDSVDSGSIEETAVKAKKIIWTEDHFKPEEQERADIKQKNNRKTVFKGSLLHISPGEELHFGSKESGERKCLIVLTNVTKNTIAFKVRTTAPDKYRVKPSNSSFEPGTTVDVVVSLHAEKDCLNKLCEEKELAKSLFWKKELKSRFEPAENTDIVSPTVKILIKGLAAFPPSNKRKRLRCHVIENKPTTLLLKETSLNNSASSHDDLHFKLNQLIEKNRRLEEQVGQCLWFQQLLAVLLSILIAIAATGMYMLKHQGL
ncbi:motile sperm domain-containing protein 2 [Bombina bombina]|uniref:motile sperm domain-containing protein 2 n=1 Tax=Bombina bombina TaxID=8345 RepID=UPI00235A58C4|nr:motile sperm domain-containing protein 2 [Bombina bombina]